MKRDKTGELQTERDHSGFLEELLRALCSDGWDQLTIYEAKKKKAEIAVLNARVSELEGALRLCLAVSPDDPLIITPAEKEAVMLKEQIAALNALFSNEINILTKENNALTAENRRLRELCAELVGDDMKKEIE